MKQNIAGFDGVLRVILAIVLLCYGVIFSSWWGLLAIIPFTTATLGWCPLYSIFGINSDKDVV